MPQDPFHGRASSEGGPYDHALTITPSDTEDLPVIPSAIMFQSCRTIYTDAAGLETETPSNDPVGVWNRYPYNPAPAALDLATRTANFILMEMKDGSRVSVCAPSLYHLHQSVPQVIEMRPKRILRTGTTFGTLTLLW